MAIPRRIHQIFLTGELPPRLRQHVADIKARNPGWTHTLYSDADAERFVLSQYGQSMLDVYRRIDPAYGAARADLLRHLIIYKLGGVYLDIKSDIRKPLDEVLRDNDQYILTQWRNGPGQPEEGYGLHPELAHIPGGEYPNHHLIAVPGHAFSKAAIDRIVTNILHYRPWSGVGKMGVVRTTGPVAYTLAIHPLRPIAPHRLVTEEEIGTSLSIEDYSHGETFKRHYSTLSIPVVRMSPLGAALQKGVEWLRKKKGATLGPRRRRSA